jgi:triacylglycerol lipase
VKSAFLKALAVAAVSCALVAPYAVHAKSNYDQTRYPVVLLHGFFGFDSIGPVDYFYGVADALKSSGATVLVSEVSAANTSSVRGEQLLAELQRWQAAYGYAKFNLIGHSQGGIDARYVAAVAPNLVASVTTVSAPNTGSAVADAVIAGTTSTGTTAWVDSVLNGLASVVSAISGDPSPQNSSAALAELSTAGSAAFNAAFPAALPKKPCGQGAPQVNGIYYYSVGGTSVVTNLLDLSDYSLLLTASTAFGLAPNDGMVGQCSSHLGKVLADNYAWNHQDAINQIFGLRGLFSPDPVEFYRTQVNRLKKAGL